MREVRTAPELSLVLTNNRQLDDIERFTAIGNFTVPGVAPTLNICAHLITITTYRHPLLIVRNTEVRPVMIGPIPIHDSNKFDSYFTLTSTMIRLKPSLFFLFLFVLDVPHLTNEHRTQDCIAS